MQLRIQTLIGDPLPRSKKVETAAHVCVDIFTTNYLYPQENCAVARSHAIEWLSHYLVHFRSALSGPL